jgi:hypothetical protein
MGHHFQFAPNDKIVAMTQMEPSAQSGIQAPQKLLLCHNLGDPYGIY